MPSSKETSGTPAVMRSNKLRWLAAKVSGAPSDALRGAWKYPLSAWFKPHPPNELRSSGHGEQVSDRPRTCAALRDATPSATLRDARSVSARLRAVAARVEAVWAQVAGGCR